MVLQAFPGIPGSDYINANYIRGASGSRAYIASQGPLPNTVPDFWRMVVECDVQVIIMASNETEGGKVFLFTAIYQFKFSSTSLNQQRQSII